MPVRSPRRRMQPEDRRAQLLAVAAALLGTGGSEAVQMTTVAAEAGVTRPVVYRHFASRRELLLALLEDFESALVARFVDVAPRIDEGGLVDVARAFVDCVCDTIVDRGAGPWNLLSARWVDPELAGAGGPIMDRLVLPWLEPLADLDTDPAMRVAVARMVVASGRAALEPWIDGALPREKAAALAATGVSSLLSGFGVVRETP